MWGLWGQVVISRALVSWVGERIHVGLESCRHRFQAYFLVSLSHQLMLTAYADHMPALCTQCISLLQIQ